MSSTLDTFVEELEEALREYIDSERERITMERDFLQKVLDGRTDGVTIEDVSTDLTKYYLTGYLGRFLPITDDPEA